MSICLGFGEREGNCANVAGGHRSHLWCVECDKARIASITASMQKITDSFASLEEDRRV